MRVSNADVVAERDFDATKSVEEEFFVADSLENAVEANGTDGKSSGHVEVLNHIGDLASWVGVQNAVRAEGSVETIPFASTSESVKCRSVAKK